MRENEFDVGYWLLDDELVDSEGRRCGRVDDLEFDGKPGEKMVLSAILSGPGAFRRRFPRRLWRIADRFLTDAVIRVPWDRVKRINATVELKGKGGELGLGRGDDLAGEVIRRIPGS